jgi:hypothetical protein
LRRHPVRSADWRIFDGGQAASDDPPVAGASGSGRPPLAAPSATPRTSASATTRRAEIGGEAGVARRLRLRRRAIVKNRAEARGKRAGVGASLVAAAPPRLGRRVFPRLAIARRLPPTASLSRSRLACRFPRRGPFRPPPAGSHRSGRRHSPSISWRREFRLKWAVKGARIARRKTGVSRRPMRAPPAAVETLDSPFQSEKGLSQEIDGELRRPGSAALRRERAYLVAARRLPWGNCLVGS